MKGDTKILLAVLILFGILFVALPLILGIPLLQNKAETTDRYYSYVYQGSILSDKTTSTPTPIPTPASIIAPQQQMSYADWQKQEDVRVKAEQDRKAFEESNASECYTDLEGFAWYQSYNNVTSVEIKEGKLYHGLWCVEDQYGFKSCMNVGRIEGVPLSQAKHICTGKRNGEPFTEVQSVVCWDSAGNEIENVTFTRG